MTMSDNFAGEWVEGGAPVWFDRGRVAAGIVTGVGFLGAGTIITIGNKQHGLTTAAMIWFVASLGVALGSGYYLIAALATVFALAVVVGMGALEHVLPSRGYFTLRLRFTTVPTLIE
jgi:putative Mg2+ transporter-C (MgtC) family protein